MPWKTCKNFYLERQAHQKQLLLLKFRHKTYSLYKWKKHKNKKKCKRKLLILFNLSKKDMKMKKNKRRVPMVLISTLLILLSNCKILYNNIMFRKLKINRQKLLLKLLFILNLWNLVTILLSLMEFQWFFKK